MASYGWNIPKRPYHPSQIAYRICNHVFTSTQALISHIETHMIDDISSLRRQSNGVNLISCQRINPYYVNPPSLPSHVPPNFLSLSQNSYILPSLQEIRNNPVLCGTPNPQIISPSPRPIPPQPQIPFLAMRNNNYPPLLPPPLLQAHVTILQLKKPKEEQPSSDDCTKPLIQKLEKPYKAEVKGDGNNQNNSDLNMLDLTLKL